MKKWKIPQIILAIAGIAFVILAGRHYYLKHQVRVASQPETSRTAYQPRQEWGLAVAPTSPCDSREQSYTFEASKPSIPFNRAGQCGPVLWFKGHCVWVLGYKDTTPVRLCDKPGMPQGNIPPNMEYAWSADGYGFRDKIRLDPPRNTSLVHWAR